MTDQSANVGSVHRGSYSAIHHPEWKRFTRNPINTVANPRLIAPFIPVGLSGQSLHGKAIVQGTLAIHDAIHNVDRSDRVKVPLQLYRDKGTAKQAAENVKYAMAMEYAGHPDNAFMSSDAALAHEKRATLYGDTDKHQSRLERAEEKLRVMEEFNEKVDKGLVPGPKYSKSDIKSQRNRLQRLATKRVYLEKAVADPALKWKFTAIRKTPFGRGKPANKLAGELFSRMKPLQTKAMEKNNHAEYIQFNGVFTDQYTGNQIALLLDTSDPDKPQVIVAHSSSGSPSRGNDASGRASRARMQWRHNLENYLTNAVPSSVEQALDFGKMVRDAVEDYNESIKDDPTKPKVGLVTVGHSRGGALAQLVAAETNGKAVCGNSAAPNAQLRRRVNMLYTQDKKRGTEITHLAVKGDWVSNSFTLKTLGAGLEMLTGAAYPRHMGRGMEWKPPTYVESNHGQLTDTLIYHACHHVLQTDASPVPLRQTGVSETGDDASQSSTDDSSGFRDYLIRQDIRRDYTNEFSEIRVAIPIEEEEEDQSGDSHRASSQGSDDDGVDLLAGLVPDNANADDAAADPSQSGISAQHPNMGRALDADDDEHEAEDVDPPSLRGMSRQQTEDVDDEPVQWGQDDVNDGALSDTLPDDDLGDIRSRASTVSTKASTDPSAVHDVVGIGRGLSEPWSEDEPLRGQNALGSDQPNAIPEPSDLAGRMERLRHVRMLDDMTEAIKQLKVSADAISQLRDQVDDASSTFRRALPTKWFGRKERFDGVRIALRASNFGNHRSLRAMRRACHIFARQRLGRKAAEVFGMGPGPKTAAELKQALQNDKMSSGKKKVQTAEFLDYHAERMLIHRDRLLTCMAPILNKSVATDTFSATEIQTLQRAHQELSTSPIALDPDVKRLAGQIAWRLDQLEQR